MQKLQLTIPEPCHENWQNMTPTDQGRFCNSCAKEVIDFSTMTDMQVLNYFTNITHEKVCGRALPEQLDRTLSRPEHPKKKIFWYWNYIVMFLMFFGKGNSARAQGNTQIVTTADLNKIKQTDINNALAGKVGKVAVNNNRIVSGKVTDKDGSPVPFASIKVKATNTGVSADANGAYSIKVNFSSILIISAAGFNDMEVATGTQPTLNTILERAGKNLGEVIVTVAGSVRRRPVIEKGNNSTIELATKKLPVKNLDTVTVTAFSNRLVGQLTRTTCTTTSVMGAMTKGITVKSTVTDSLIMLANKITGAIKVYPNPVQQGIPFNVALKLKQAGLYLMQVTDATGRTVLQKQISANSKEFIEQIVPDSRWGSGAYYISIIDSKNKLINKSSFIVQQ